MISSMTARMSSRFMLEIPFRLCPEKQMVCRITHRKLIIYFSRLLTCTGWWLCMDLKTSVQGWAPQAYLEEIVAPAPRPAPPPPPPAPKAATNGTSRVAAAAKSKPTPPAPPMKRPMGRKPIAPPDPRDSAVSMNSQDSSGGSGRATPNSLAGGLAEALRQRQSAMQGKKDDDDDDW